MRYSLTKLQIGQAFCNIRLLLDFRLFAVVAVLVQIPEKLGEIKVFDCPFIYTMAFNLLPFRKASWELKLIDLQ